MGLRRPQITKKIDGKRYAIYRDMSYDKYEAREIAVRLRKKGYKSVRVEETLQGWFIYHYPQYLD